jgi:hypothetical protein
MQQQSLALDLGPSTVTASASSSGAPAAPAPAPTQPSQSQPPAPPQSEAPPASRPDRVKVGEREFTAQELNDLAARHAAEESKRLTLPTDPNGYKIELPEDFKAPEGVKFEFRPDDPLLAQARSMAHAKGWSQTDFSDALSLYAATQVADMARLQTARQAEINKLGVNGPARITAVTNWLKGIGGADADVLVRVLDYAPHSSTVMAFERMMQKFSSQGGAGFSQQHRSQPDAGKIPGFENMSFEQRRLAQDQLLARRR